MKSKKGKSAKLHEWMKTDPRMIKIDRDELVKKYGIHFINFVANQELNYIIKWFLEDEGIDISKARGINGIRKILTGQVT